MPQVLVEISYLRSYEHMGVALVRCESGCECEETYMDGHHSERNSQVGRLGAGGLDAERAGCRGLQKGWERHRSWSSWVLRCPCSVPANAGQAPHHPLLPRTCTQPHLRRHSRPQVHLHTFFATQADKCVISVTVSNITNSGEHKMKVTGLIVSEQAGTHNAVHNAGAVEYVGDIVSREVSSGKFNVLNHARRRRGRTLRGGAEGAAWAGAAASAAAAGRGAKV